MLRVLPLQTITDQFFLGWHEVALDVLGIFVEEDFHVQSLDVIRCKRAHEVASDVGISILVVSDTTMNEQLDA
jgi:hypothetical protein